MLEFIYLILVALVLCWASLVAQMVKTLPAMWETWVQSLGWEDPLEEGMGLRCCTWAFSTCVEQGTTLHCGHMASHGDGCSCCRAQALGTQISVAVACGLSCFTASAWTRDQGLNLSPPALSRWILTQCAIGEVLKIHFASTSTK